MLSLLCCCRFGGSGFSGGGGGAVGDSGFGGEINNCDRGW